MLAAKGRGGISAIFLGSKSFGLSVFKALLDVEPSVNWSIIVPDDSEDLRSATCEFQMLAAERNLPIHIAEKASDANAYIAGIAPDILFACGWYWLLPSSFLTSIRLGCFGLHNSLLPKYRGWSPLVWSIINGDREVGGTVFRFTDEVDAGDILLQVRVGLDSDETIADALCKIEDKVQQELPARWSAYISGSLRLAPQASVGASYCGRRIEQDGRINWSRSAQEIHDFIRAQSPPYPGAFSFTDDGKKIVFLKTSVDHRVYLGTPGQMLEVQDQAVLISCGEKTALKVQLLSLDTVCRPAREVLSSTLIRLS